MKERHNIIGTEVGRPKPPIYLRSTMKIRKKRSAFRWPWLWLVATAQLLLLIFFLTN